MLEMNEYIKQQEELRKLEQQAQGGNGAPDPDKPGPLVFPDFTNFLYNKFLVGAAPPMLE
jgi:hypothetical protein